MGNFKLGTSVRRELGAQYTQLMAWEWQLSKWYALQSGLEDTSKRHMRKYLQAKFKSVKAFFPNLKKCMVETWSKCLEEQERELGVADEDCVLTRAWLGRVTSDAEMLKIGVSLAKEIRQKKYRRTPSKDIPWDFRWLTFDLLRHLGIVYEKEGRFMKSQTCLRLAWEFAETHFPSSIYKPYTALQRLGSISIALGRPQEAENYLRVCLSKLSQYKGQNNNATISCAMKYGMALQVQGKHAEAYQIFKKCYTWRCRCFDPSSVQTMQVLCDYVEALWACGKKSKIRTLLEENEGFQEWKRASRSLIPEKALILATLMGYMGELEEAIYVLTNSLEENDYTQQWNCFADRNGEEEEEEEEEDEMEMKGTTREQCSLSEISKLNCMKTLLDFHQRSGMFPEKEKELRHIVSKANVKELESLFKAAERDSVQVDVRLSHFALCIPNILVGCIYSDERSLSSTPRSVHPRVGGQYSLPQPFPPPPVLPSGNSRDWPWGIFDCVVGTTAHVWVCGHEGNGK